MIGGVNDKASLIKLAWRAIDAISAAGIDMAESAVWMTATDGLTPVVIAGHIAAGFSPAAAFDSGVAIDIGGTA